MLRKVIISEESIEMLREVLKPWLEATDEQRQKFLERSANAFFGQGRCDAAAGLPGNWHPDKREGKQ